MVYSDFHSFLFIYLVEIHVFLLQANVGILALCTGSSRRRRICWVRARNISWHFFCGSKNFSFFFISWTLFRTHAKCDNKPNKFMVQITAECCFEPTAWSSSFMLLCLTTTESSLRPPACLFNLLREDQPPSRCSTNSVLVSSDGFSFSSSEKHVLIDDREYIKIYFSDSAFPLQLEVGFTQKGNQGQWF